MTDPTEQDQSPEGRSDPDLEFSRLVPADRISPKQQRHGFSATGEERTAVAERLMVTAIDRLEVDCAIRRTAQRRTARLFSVSGTVSADVVQACIATGDPIRNTVESPFAATFSDDPAAFERTGTELAASPSSPDQPTAGGRNRREVVVDAEADDPPEPLTNGAIDVGELAVQELSLALDPYPRAPDVPPVDRQAGPRPPTDGDGDEGEDGRRRPFAKLASLTRPDDD